MTSPGAETRRQDPRQRKRRLRRRWILALWVFVLLAAGTGINAYLALRPEQIRRRIELALKEKLAADVAFSPAIEMDWTEGLEIHHVMASLPPAAPQEPPQPVFQADRVIIKPRLGALLLGRFEASEIILESPVLYLSRDAENRWTVERLLRPEALRALTLPREPEGGARGEAAAWSDGLANLPQMKIIRGAVYYRGNDGAPAPLDLGELAELSASVSREAGGNLRFNASLRTRFVDEIEVRGEWSGSRQVWNLACRISRLDLSAKPPWRLGLEPELDRYDLQGFIDGEGDLRYSPGGDPSAARPDAAAGGVRGSALNYRFAGQISQGGARLPICPHRLERLEGGFSIEDGTIEVRSLRGFLGGGSIRCSGAAALAPDWSRLLGLQIQVEGDALPFETRLLSGLVDSGLLPEQVSRAIANSRAQGQVGLDLKIQSRTFPPRLQDIAARVSIGNFEFKAAALPFEFNGLTGEMKIENGKAEIIKSITGRAGKSTLSVQGWKDLREGGGFELNATLDDLNLDDRIRNALPDYGVVYWDEFRPGGLITLNVYARKPSGVEAQPAPGEAKTAAAPADGNAAAGPGSGEPEIIITAAGKHASILYERFPYSVDGITGKLIVDVARKRLTLAELHGYHGSQEITGKGAVELDDSGRFLVELHAPSLEVEEDIKAALSPDSRRLLEDFNFSGKVETSVKVYASSKASRVAVEVELRLIDTRLAYNLFPYPLHLSGGIIRAVGEETFVFDQVETAPGSLPQAVFSGGLSTSGGGRLFEFNLTVDQLAVDDRLRTALPEDLRRFVVNLGLEGSFQGRIQGAYSYSLDRPSRNRVVYKATSVKALDAAVNFGIQLRGVEGEGEFAGGKELDGNHYFTGTAHVESAWFNRIHLQKTDMVFTFGREHPLIRDARIELQNPAARRPAAGVGAQPPAGEAKDAEAAKSGPPEPYRPGVKLVTRLVPEKVADTFQMQLFSGALYGGKVEGFLYVDVGDRHDVGGEFTASGIQVALAAPDVFRIPGNDLTGEARGQVAFSGKTGEAHSILGVGAGTIEKAKLMSLPLFVGIVGILFLQPSSDPHFREIETRYEIRDGKFRAPPPEGIAIRGDSVHLNGGGTLDFDGNLDLSLNPYFINVRIPVLDTIVDLVKKTLLQVWIEGKLEEPRVKLVTGAGLIRVPIDSKPAEGTRPFPNELKPK